MSNRAVFIHSGMRTGSTYFLHRFRILPTTMSFTEPFNEVLFKISRQVLRGLGPAVWYSKHSATDPYYLEYEPLLNENGEGIRGFQPEFVFQNYFLVDHELPEQRAYVQSLLDLADSDEKVPVLGYCGSLGRTAWLRRNFPNAYNIVLVRNPVQQWISGYAIFNESKNAYFVNSYRRILSCPGDSEYLQQVKEALKEPLEANEVRLDTMYEIFANVYGWSTSVAVAQADLVVDMDRLSVSVAYREYITEQIRSHTDIQVDFSDARLANHDPLQVPIDFYGINSFVAGSLRHWFRRNPQQLPDGLSNRGYDHVPSSVLEKMETAAPQRPSKPQPVQSAN